MLEKEDKRKKESGMNVGKEKRREGLFLNTSFMRNVYFLYYLQFIIAIIIIHAFLPPHPHPQ